MRETNTSGLQVVTKEDKEPLVKAFIEQHIDMLEADSEVAPGEYLLVARSPESPVCRALSALAPRLAEHGVSVRVVFTAIDTGAFQGDLNASAGLLEIANSRIVSDSRLYEAHEQLVLDDETCWIGDCMRREPAKRDAYETYATDAAETARSAKTSFTHFWRSAMASAPLTRFMPSVGYKDAHGAGILSHAFAETDETAPVAMTRH